LASHFPLPQQLPQSDGQLAQASPLPGSHLPLPQLAGQAPQSPGQTLQLSPKDGSHLPLPQQTPQSPGQLLQLSEASHLPLPQVVGQGPQSVGQLVQLSVGLHTPLPQAGILPSVSAPASMPTMLERPHPDGGRLNTNRATITAAKTYINTGDSWFDNLACFPGLSPELIGRLLDRVGRKFSHL